MANSAPNGDSPLSLFQILEDEHYTLQGPLPAGYREAKRRILDQPPTENNEQRVNEALVSELHRNTKTERTTALCLSGGGIRSATFGLGVLQGLARRGLLDQFHYLSTVSGGGYVGSWLTSWIRRKGLSAVLTDLKGPPTSKMNPEPDAIRHLREYSNYLTPQLGVFSADTWTLIATYLRNLAVNWFVWLPLLIVILMLPRLVVAIAAYNPHGRLGFVVLLLGAGFGPVILALAYICLNLPSVRNELGDYNHFFRRRDDQGSFLTWCLTPLLASAFCLTTAWAWLRNSQGVRLDDVPFVRALPIWEPLLVFVLIGVFTHLLGWLAAIGLLVCGGGKGQGRLQAIGRFWGAYHFSEIVAILVSGALGGISTWALATKVFPNPSDDRHIALFTCFAVPLLLFSFLVAGAVYVGLASRWTSDDDREWWARSSGWILIATVAWTGLSSIVVFGPPLLLQTPKLLGSVGGVAGLLTLLLGFSAKTAATSATEKGNWTTLLLTVAPILAAPAALFFLFAFLALLTGWILQGLPGMVVVQTDAFHSASFPAMTDTENYRIVLHHTSGWWLTALAGLMILFTVPMALIINVNKFSLHSIYRNRLIRAYLGASNERRTPNLFTGFDPQDNFEMYQLAPDSPSAASGPRLFHIVNIALNLVGEKKQRLAWQERKAESFTVSPLHVGNWLLGYRRAEDYGKNASGEGISLGTAISISGAAASPNMGYHSSPLVTLLMTLFNARLGWWLGNPGKAGSETFDKTSPTFSIGPMIYEALGFTTDDYQYVYLSDGGHFENLGLYEMVLRHCRFILAVDSGRDPECAFDDLGNAIRKIRIDLGIPITLQKVRIYSRATATRKPHDIPKYCAIGSIGYSLLDAAEPNGILIYIKPALAEDEPVDVYNYAQTNRGFPHESTGDQWFSESQFESYRMLGSHILEQITGKEWEEDLKNWTDDAMNRGKSRLDFFLAQVQRYLGEKPGDQHPEGEPPAHGNDGAHAKEPLAVTREGATT